MAVDVPRVASQLRRTQFSYTSERELQEGVALLFDGLGIEYTREHELTQEDRIDFWLDDGVGLEIKIQESLTSVTRQLHRYAQCDSVRALILLTTKMAHRKMPEEMNGKPLIVVYQRPF